MLTALLVLCLVVLGLGYLLPESCLRTPPAPIAAPSANDGSLLAPIETPAAAYAVPTSDPEAARARRPTPHAPACAALKPPVSEDGRCDGELLRYCYDGVPQAVDCAALGQHCAVDDSGGANCVRTQRRCTVSAAGECVGKNVLAHCDGELLRLTRCDPGRCELGADKRAHCVHKRVVPVRLVGACRGCDCPEGPEGDEVCDGYDNNRDGTVDEGVTCLTIDVVAFVLDDENGRPVEANDRVVGDLDRANRALSEPGHDTGLRLSLREIRRISRPGWLDATGATLRDAQNDPEIAGVGQPFYVPVVYTRRLKVGQKRVAGIGALPDNSCADVRFPGAGDGSGAVLLVPDRSETTFAHELGHFFGLCHTHMDALRPQLSESVVRTGSDDEPLVCPICARSGDGICDTPRDPGANGGCVLDETSCSVSCPSGDTPEAANLMSYYQPCRRWFSAEQTLYLRRNLWRRLRWRECLLDSTRCSCTVPAAEAPGRCDSASTRMRCQLDPGQSAGLCEPAGSGGQGDRCADSRECDTGLWCLFSVCTQP